MAMAMTMAMGNRAALDHGGGSGGRRYPRPRYCAAQISGIYSPIATPAGTAAGRPNTTIAPNHAAGLPTMTKPNPDIPHAGRNPAAGAGPPVRVPLPPPPPPRARSAGRCGRPRPGVA